MSSSRLPKPPSGTARACSPFLFFLSPIRAREAGAAALWPMAERWSPAPTMVSELPGHRQPIAKSRRTDTVRLPARNATALNDQRNSPFLFFLSPIRAREAGAAALWPMAERWSPAPTMCELPGHRQPIAKSRRTDTGRLRSRAQRFALKDQRNRPVFIFSLTYTRARGGRRRALADGRTMVAGADESELPGHRQPIAKFRRTDTGRLRSLAQRFALKDQRNRPVFIFSLTYTRARGGRRRALADGRTMVAGADE